MKYAFNVIRMTLIAMIQRIIKFNINKKFYIKNSKKKLISLNVDKLLNESMKRK